MIVSAVKYDRYSLIRSVLSTVLELSTDGVRLNMPSVRRPAVAQDVFIVKSLISTLFKFFCPSKSRAELVRSHCNLAAPAQPCSYVVTLSGCVIDSTDILVKLPFKGNNMIIAARAGAKHYTNIT